MTARTVSLTRHSLSRLAEAVRSTKQFNRRPRGVQRKPRKHTAIHYWMTSSDWEKTYNGLLRKDSSTRFVLLALSSTSTQVLVAEATSA